jgi:flagellar hook-basal body complex protein FliE
MSFDAKTIVRFSQIPAAPGSGAESKTPAGGGFGELLEKTITEVNDAQIRADQAVEQLHTGQAKNIHEVMIALEKADISMRLMVQMRNKVVDAYQEIMRMQV